MEAEMTRDIIRFIRDKDGVKLVERVHDLDTDRQENMVRVTLDNGSTLRMRLSWVQDKEESWIFDQRFPPTPRVSHRTAKEQELAPAGH